jgi:hypothetical protein
MTNDTTQAATTTRHTNHTRHDPDPDRIDVRETVNEGSDAFLTVRMPVASTETARDNQAFSRERLAGWRSQIEDRQVSLFVDHGKNEMTGSRYSALGKIGVLDAPELNDRDDGETDLEADLKIADPDALAEAGDTGDIEAALRYIAQQARLGLLTASVGWSEDAGDREVPGDGSEILEVSLVGIPSDTAAEQQASATPPTEAATRGLEDLPSKEETRRPDDWGMQFWDGDDPTDAERVGDALDALQHVREFHAQDDDVPLWKRRDETPPELDAIDDVREEFDRDRDDADLEATVEKLQGDSYHGERRRENVLDALDTIDGSKRKLATPQRDTDRAGAVVTVYPFGRSRGESTDRIAEAVEAIRDVLTEDDDHTDLWGLQPRDADAEVWR